MKFLAGLLVDNTKIPRRRYAEILGLACQYHLFVATDRICQSCGPVAVADQTRNVLVEIRSRRLGRNLDAHSEFVEEIESRVKFT